jgi:hypothetical protein
MKKSILALAVSLVAASGAHAAWDTGYNPSANNFGNGEALFEAFDEVNGVSYALDLGVRYNDLISGAAFSGQSFTVDLSVFGGSVPSNVNWQIAVGSGNKRNAANTAADFSKYGFITSTDASYTSLLANQTSGAIQSALTGLNQIRQLTANTAGADSVNNAVTEASPFGSKYYAGTITTNFMAVTFGIDTAGSIGGETLSLWNYGFGTASSTKYANLLGTVTLAGNKLTFNAPVVTPEVPVPAAAWMMGSALLGLGGLARRRNKA